MTQSDDSAPHLRSRVITDAPFAADKGPPFRFEPSGCAKRPATVYVHFPYCLEKCPYCDFVSYVEPRIEHERYADAIVRELHARESLYSGRRFQSIFFGGGTPSLWKTEALGRVLGAIHASLDMERDPEITVECNPTSLNEDKAAALLQLGVNRLSIGVQSLSTERLRYLGRMHDAAGALSAIRAAKRAGVQRVSGDLIFGLPGQSPSEARDEALSIASEGLAHLSSYQLTIEPGTRFGELARRGRLPLADEGAVAESFSAIDEALEGAGLRHYEVSNYARPGHEARHNLGYWQGHEYLGLGCGAVGYRETSSLPLAVQGVRWRNAVRPEQYMAATEQPSLPGSLESSPGDHAVTQSIELLDAECLLRERIMLGLRLYSGIEFARTAASLGQVGWTRDRERARVWLAARGRIVIEGDVIRVPRAAWLWVDDTAARLF